MEKFTLKSGNKTSFKEMGAIEADSPAKDYKKGYYGEGKSSPAKQAIGGDAGEQLTSWNKYKAEKSKKNFDARQASKQKGKDFVKNLKAKGDLASKKPTSTLSRTAKTLQNTPKQYVKTAKNVAKKALKGAGRLAGGLGVATTLYSMYKSGQKHSGGKAVKGQKTGVVAPKKSIYDKKK